MGTKPRGADKQTLRRVLNAMRPLISFQMIVRSTVSFLFSLFMGGGGVLTILYGVQSSFVHLSIIIIKEV